jgi:signal transduction histidine kinase
VRPSRLLRTATFRLALAYAGLFGASVAVLFSIIYWTMNGYATSQFRAAVRTETESLIDEAGGPWRDNLRRAVERRLREGGQKGSFYLLQDARGRWLAGNLPATSRLLPGWRELAVPDVEEATDGESVFEDRGQHDRLLGFATITRGGDYLFVGKDAHDLTELRELIVRTFGWAGAVTVVLAVGGGVVMSWAFLHRVEAINATTRAIIEGDLGGRVPVRASDDEFDRLARNINSMLDRVQGLMERVHQVSNDIAHDLRTPLARLRQKLEGARLRSGSVAEYDTAVDEAIVEADGILATFAALLRIAQIEAGSRRAGFADVDLSAAFAAVAEAFAPVAEDGGQLFTARIAPDVCVRGDRQLLTQMLVNLVENALRHTPPGAHIELALRATDEGPVGIIADTGPGIPAEAREKVFRRFFRLEQSRTSPGSGLGLSLVAAVADLHGIRIELGDNRPGLKVTLTFPPSRAHLSRAHP